MAQRIVTLCDEHLSRGEERAGASWRLAVQRPGGKLATYDVDACEECAEPFAQLAAFLVEVGRPENGKGATSRATPFSRQDDPNTPVEERTCPACGFVSVNRKSMRSHLWAQHKQRLGKTAPDAAPDAPPDYTCPECGKSFMRAQGLGAHRSRAHGVAGSSKDAKAYRDARAAG